MSNLTGMVVIPFCTVISAGSANASASSREISNDVFCCLSFDSAANVGKGNENNNVKATFFITAHYLNTQPELVKQMIDEGHIVRKSYCKS